jgi:histidinol-phosphate aminotransferase
MAILGLSPEVAAKSAYPPHFDIETVLRPNILALQPYRCARDDYKTGVLLDANENALGHSIPPSAQFIVDEFLDADLHRYPDPSHDEVKDRIARLRNIPGPQYIFLGVGSDEVIDLLMRVCCVPGKDKILTTPPTYGMYAVCAHVNDVPIVKVSLDVAGGVFQPQIDHVSVLRMRITLKSSQLSPGPLH